MASWSKDDDNEFLAGVMAVLSQTQGGDQGGSKNAGRGASKAAPKRRGKKQEAAIDTSSEFSFEKTLGKRQTDADSLGSSPEPNFRAAFGGLDDDGNDFEGIASTIQQDLEREMTKKKKAKTASIAAQSKKCNEMIKAEAAWFDRELEALKQKEHKENEIFKQQALVLLQENEKYSRHFNKAEGVFKKGFDELAQEETALSQTIRQMAAKLLSKSEPAGQRICARMKALLAEKKKKEEELEQVLMKKKLLADQVLFKIQQMSF